MKDRILAAIRSSQDEIADFTKRLVSIPTENPPGRGYAECVRAIAEKLDEIGLPHEALEVPAPSGAAKNAPALPRYCLLSHYGTGEPTLYFHGHYDVVPAATSSQFSPDLRGGNLFGRGASDMKSGLAAMIYAVKAIKDLRIHLGGRIGLVFVPDEETGGEQGSRYLADRGILGRHGIGMLTPEPTGGVVWNACRGAISMRVRVKGKAAHVGLQHLGVNAFEGMLKAAAALLELKNEVETRATAFRITPEAARRSILMLGGRVEGGTSFNVVPAGCSFTVERRLNPEEHMDTEKQGLLALFDRLRQEGIDLEVEIFQEGRPAGVSESEPAAQALARSVEDVTGRAPAFEMCPGLLEIRFYAEKGVPAFAYGPGLLSVSHAPNEFVSLHNICSCAAIYALCAVRLLGAESSL